MPLNHQKHYPKWTKIYHSINHRSFLCFPSSSQRLSAGTAAVRGTSSGEVLRCSKKRGEREGLVSADKGEIPISPRDPSFFWWFLSSFCFGIWAVFVFDLGLTKRFFRGLLCLLSGCFFLGKGGLVSCRLVLLVESFTCSCWFSWFLPMFYRFTLMRCMLF